MQQQQEDDVTNKYHRQHYHTHRKERSNRTDDVFGDCIYFYSNATIERSPFLRPPSENP